MDLSSSLSGSKEFRIVKRGYDPDEVNAFLDQIALGVGELKRKLAEAEDRAVAVQAAPRPTPAAPAAPAPDPAAVAEAEEIHRALILAQRAADEEVRKATEEGEGLIADARRRADEMRSEVEAEVTRRRDEGRADLLAELDELERVRDSLANDVVVLERHVDEQREVVQAAIGELQSLLDHPEAFRIAAASGVSTVVPPLDRPAPDDGAPDDSGASGPDVPAVPVVDAPAVPTVPAAEEPSPVLAKAPKSAPAPAPPPSAAPPAPPAPEASGDRTPPSSAPVPPPAPADQTVRIPSPPAPPAPPADLFSGPAGGDDDDRDVGPPTEAVSAVGDAGDPEEDAFLAELRKAMLDDEPLGPRDPANGATGTSGTGFDDDDVTGRGRSRFGRRR